MSVEALVGEGEGAMNDEVLEALLGAPQVAGGADGSLFSVQYSYAMLTRWKDLSKLQ